MRIGCSGRRPSRVEVILGAPAESHYIAGSGLDGCGAGLTVIRGRSIGLSSSPPAGGRSSGRK
jgi:hypothetical protein